MSKKYRNKDWEADPYIDYSQVEIPEMILARSEVRFLGQLVFHDQNRQDEKNLGQSAIELSMHPSINEAQLIALRSSIGDALASGYWSLSHQLIGEIQYTLTPPIETILTLEKGTSQIFVSTHGITIQNEFMIEHAA